MKCWQSGRAAIQRARLSPLKRAVHAGGRSFRRERPASGELPTSAAELIIALVATEAEEAGKGTAPPGQPEAAA